MRRIRQLIDNEHGVALVLALMILLTLTGLVLAFLSASAFEPQISRNHSETVRARYVAEAGVEYAYDTLASNVGSWDTYLDGATCAQGAVLGAPNSTLPGLGGAHGMFTVRIRNDCKPGDGKLTGGAVDTVTGRCDPAVPGDATHDGNCKVVVTSTGTIGATTRTITVVVSKTAALPINGALGFPGAQADVVVRGSSFVIDGRDTKIADRPGAPTGVAAAVYGSAVNGILIVENGIVEIGGSFRWNGPIVVTGRNVGIRFRGDGSQVVYGATIVNELNPVAVANIEGDSAGKPHILYSNEALSLVQ